jgi:uncharacterized protein (TIGR02597 family)
VATAAANSDTRVSPTLARPPAARGTVASVTGSTVSVSGSPGWSTNAFVTANTHYVRFLSGALRGQFLIITANSAASLTVDSAGLNLATLAAGDTFEVTPFWTLGTLFPASLAGTAFTATTSPFLPQTQLLFFDGNGTGINRAANAIYFFYNGAWRKSGANIGTSFDSTLIYPDSYFIQRNKTTGTSLSYVGRVQPSALGTILEAATTQNDNYVSISFPMDITLANSGLAASGFQVTTSTFQVKDQLLWFDPAGTGINRAADGVFFYFNGAWRKSGQPVTSDFGSTVLKAGAGFIVRKASNGTSATSTYLTGI